MRRDCYDSSKLIDTMPSVKNLFPRINTPPSLHTHYSSTSLDIDNLTVMSSQAHNTPPQSTFGAFNYSQLTWSKPIWQGNADEPTAHDRMCRRDRKYVSDSSQETRSRFHRNIGFPLHSWPPEQARPLHKNPNKAWVSCRLSSTCCQAGNDAYLNSHTAVKYHLDVSTPFTTQQVVIFF